MVFNKETTADQVVEGVDLSGYETIVTGASSGIGIETARALAKAGARVVIAARDLTRAQEVAEDIIKSTGNKNVEVERLELDSLENVRDFTKRYLAKNRPLHILINNAGVMACPLSYTKDGFENQFGTNHIGHFVLTLGLLPALKAAAKANGKKARVISVSSSCHGLSNINFDDVNFKNRPYNPFEAYGQSKTANILFSVGFTKRFADDGIVSNALMPGVIKTNLQRHFTKENLLKMGWLDEKGGFGFDFIPCEQGAATSVWAAVAPELEGKGGLYFENCAIAPLRKDPEQFQPPYSGVLEYALDEKNADRLWELTEKLIQSTANTN